MRWRTRAVVLAAAAAVWVAVLARWAIVSAAARSVVNGPTTYACGSPLHPHDPSATDPSGTARAADQLCHELLASGRDAMIIAAALAVLGLLWLSSYWRWANARPARRPGVSADVTVPGRAR